MVIVLIHWRIKPTDEAVAAFFQKWKTGLTIDDKTNLVGEFLSEPLPATGFKFQVDDLARRAGEPEHRAFVNVGLWKDWESFEQQVGRYFNDDRPLEPFEATRRTRTILETREWRIGSWKLSSHSTAQ
jgi:hypothetical protein